MRKSERQQKHVVSPEDRSRCPDKGDWCLGTGASHGTSLQDMHCRVCNPHSLQSSSSDEEWRKVTGIFRTPKSVFLATTLNRVFIMKQPKGDGAQEETEATAHSLYRCPLKWAQPEGLIKHLHPLFTILPPPPSATLRRLHISGKCRVASLPRRTFCY